MSTYNFEQMVNEAYQILEEPIAGEYLVLPNMQIDIGTTRLHWKNVKAYLKTISRNPDYFMEFLKHEIPGKSVNWFSGSKSDGLIIHGKKQKSTEITNLSIKFVNTYVLCSACKKSNTLMNKLTSKTYEIICNDCGTTKTCVM